MQAQIIHSGSTWTLKPAGSLWICLSFMHFCRYKWTPINADLLVFSSFLEVTRIALLTRCLHIVSNLHTIQCYYLNLLWIYICLQAFRPYITSINNAVFIKTVLMFFVSHICKPGHMFMPFKCNDGCQPPAPHPSGLHTERILLNSQLHWTSWGEDDLSKSAGCEATDREKPDEFANEWQRQICSLFTKLNNRL